MFKIASKILSGLPRNRTDNAIDEAVLDKYGIEVNFAGKSFRIDPTNGADQVAREIGNGSYEAPLPMLMMATIIRIEGAFIDVGANTGIYSVMASIIAPGRQVLAFEPFQTALDAINRNVAINNLEHTIKISNVALSNRSGRAILHVPDPSHGLIETSASLEAEFKPHHASNSVIEVEVSTLDAIDVEGPIGVIKVDIEGHEYAFLEGAKESISRDRPIIFIELLNAAPMHKIRKIARELNYLDFRLRPDLAIHDGGEIIYDPQAWNHALVPAERLHKFQEACNSCGLTMVRNFVLS